MNLLEQELQANARKCADCLAIYHSLRTERNNLIVRAWLLHQEHDEPDSGASVQAIAERTGLSRMSVYAVIKREAPADSWPTAAEVIEGQVTLVDALAAD
jgi:hypothetical protein